MRISWRQACERMVRNVPQVLPPDADMPSMNVSGQSATSLLDSTLTADTTRQDVGVALLKKAQDIEKLQGQALVQMLDQAAPPADGHLDVYA
jgi:hypothetical protein